MCLGVLLLGVIFLGSLLTSRPECLFPSPAWASFSAIIFSDPFLSFLTLCLIFPFWNFYNVNIIPLNVVSVSLKNFNFLIFFSFCCSVWMIFIGLSSKPMIHSAASSSQLLCLPSVFFQFSYHSLKFQNFRPFLYFLSLCWKCCHVLHSLSEFIIFMTITLTSLSSRCLSPFY